jgi:hypothetical protein
MATHYQVIAHFKFSGCHPLLVSLTFHTTKAACSKWPVFPPGAKGTAISHIFPTQEKAHTYITRLFTVYPNSTAVYPVLDKGQQDLFQGEQQCTSQQ